MTELELTVERFPRFLEALAEAMPGLKVIALYPQGRQRAASVFVRIPHTGTSRNCHYPPEGGAFFYLTDDEKNAIGTAVGKAAVAADVEVLYKPSWSRDSEVAYRVFATSGSPTR